MRTNQALRDTDEEPAPVVPLAVGGRGLVAAAFLVALPVFATLATPAVLAGLATAGLPLAVRRLAR